MSYRLAREAALREERIQACMARTDAPHQMMMERGYCEALIDGEDAVALAGEREKLIREHLGIKQEQKKMTRDEAVNKAFNKLLTGYKESYSFVCALEALGLIKFEEPKSAWEKFSGVMVADFGFSSAEHCSSNTLNAISKALDKAGLKIVEK